MGSWPVVAPAGARSHELGTCSALPGAHQECGMSDIRIYINPLTDRSFATPAPSRAPLSHPKKPKLKAKKKPGGVPGLMRDALVALGLNPNQSLGIRWLADHVAVSFGLDTRFIDRKKARWLLQEFVAGRINRQNFSETLATYVRTPRAEKKKSRKHHHKQRAKNHVQRSTRDGWWIKYEAYINSPEWKLFRRTIIKARGKKCEDCSAAGPVLHLHHLTYERLGNELPEDVRLLCEPCHQKQHPHKRITRQSTTS